MQRPKSRGGLVFSLLFFAMVALAWVQRQTIYDWIQLRNYVPPVSIAGLANATTMNASGRKIFYVQHPELDDKSNFNTHCRFDEQTIVLGCYISRQGIYVLNVDDARLSGVKEVTAAHEMLHAAYERLDKNEQKKVNLLIDEAYKNVTDERIKNTIEQYRLANADITNELHSILGTEVRNLPPALEVYYQRYFTNRAAVVVFSEKYEQVFTEKQNIIKALTAQIDQLEKELIVQRAKLDSEDNALQSEGSRLDNLKRQGRIDEYNSGVPGYNASFNRFKNDVTAYNAKLAAYKSLIDQHNQLAQQQRELNQAINSNIKTQQSK